MQIEACSRQVERVLRITASYEIFTQEGAPSDNGAVHVMRSPAREVAAGADAAAVSGD